MQICTANEGPKPSNQMSHVFKDIEKTMVMSQASKLKAHTNAEVIDKLLKLQILTEIMVSIL